DRRIIGIETDDVGEARRKPFDRLFGERKLIARDTTWQLLSCRRPIVEDSGAHARRIHDRDRLFESSMSGVDLCVNELHRWFCLRVFSYSDCVCCCKDSSQKEKDDHGWWPSLTSQTLCRLAKFEAFV